jgi:thiol-disulfide isomerase/thioredoxin
MKFISILLTFLLLEGSPQWGNDFDKAKFDAIQNHKYIVINFSGSDWCGPCIKLTRDILDSPEFLKYATTNLALVRADFPRLKKNQLDKLSDILVDQIRAIDNKRFITKLGKLTNDQKVKLKNNIRIVLDI